MKEDITNYNDKGEFHGYFERYHWISDELSFKCFYFNGIEIDYEEFYHYNGILEKRFYI